MKIPFGITCLLSLATLHCCALNRPDLYSDIDDVLRLNSSTFGPNVFSPQGNTSFVVQFYNTFCGHCQAFAPVYKELGTRLKNWTSVVKVAAVDCSKDENVNTCSENKIAGYPTVLIFPPNARPDDKPQNFRDERSELTIDDMEEVIIDYISKLKRPNRVTAALSPIEKADLKSLQENADKETTDGEKQDLMIVVESEKSYLARKLILEYYRISHKLELRRVLLSNTNFLKSVLSARDLANLDKNQPILLRITNPDEKASVLVKGEISSVLPTSGDSERADFVLARFKAFLDHFFSIELKEVDSNAEFDAPIIHLKTTSEPSSEKRRDEMILSYVLHETLKGSDRIFSIDLLKGITYMLTHEVKIKGDLTPEEVTTVRNVLTVLKKYLPLERWDSTLHNFIVNLRIRLDDKRLTYEKDGISGQEMRDLLDLSGAEAAKNKYKDEVWVSCMESNRHNKGYTCSLWLLFHSLTVGEYLKAAPVQVKPILVLHTMRDYITRFLGCTVCSMNFKRETERLDDSIVHRNSSVLWLWMTHNHVNQRLNNESLEKRPLKKVIFPSVTRCPQCYETSPDDIGQDGKTLTDVRWNMLNIPMYLVDLYRPDRVISPEELSTLMSEAQDKLGYRYMPPESRTDINDSVERGSNQSIFSTSDMSICIFLYVSCTVIVVVVCVALNPKWKRFKTK